MAGFTQFDHPQFTIIREARFSAVQGPAEEVTYAQFRSRSKCLLRFVHITCTSNPSATTQSIHVVRSGATIASKTWTHVSAGGAENSMLITLTTLNTLHTITEVAGVECSGAGGLGKWDLLYEYQMLPPYTIIGS